MSEVSEVEVDGEIKEKKEKKERKERKESKEGKDIEKKGGKEKKGKEGKEEKGKDGKEGKGSKEDKKLMKEAKKYREALEKRGVIYLSRVPPFMKPNKARSMFEQYGEVTRLYLAEEDGTIRQKRKDSGGNGSKQFGEGWIEYSDKKIARNVAESLNNTLIGGKKGSFYHDDIWNIKYLKNFKWEYLTEKVAYERRIQESKMRLAMTHAKRSSAEMMELMEQTKVQNIIEDRKRKRQDANPDSRFNTLPTDTSNKKTRNIKQVQSLGTVVGDRKFDHKINKSFLSSVFNTDKS